MFGFLNPFRRDLAYRRVYTRCCQHQHLNYGLLSLPFLSYESIFLYLCALDASRTPCTLPNQLCCRLRASKRLRHAPDAELGRFCSAFSLILAATKLADDIRDGWSPWARLSNWLLKKRVAEARHYMTAIDSNFKEKINSFIHRHLALEKADGNFSLHDYAQPTADAFGYIFGLMAGVPGVQATKDTLTLLGQHIGAALIAFDCASDWRRDKAKGEFNPLSDATAVHSAIAYCHEQLLTAAQVCRQSFGSECETAKVLLAVREDVRVVDERTFYGDMKKMKRLLQERGFIKQKGVVTLYAGCPLDALDERGKVCCLCLCALSVWGSWDRYQRRLDREQRTQYHEVKIRRGCC